MIDLSKNKLNLYQIKLEDGTLLKIKNPTQRILAQMVELQEMGASNGDIEVLSYIYELITAIFNRNTNQLSFTKEQVEDMLDIQTATLFLQDYLKEMVDKLGE